MPIERDVGIPRRDFLKVGAMTLGAIAVGKLFSYLSHEEPPDFDESLRNSPKPPATPEQIEFIRNNYKEPVGMILEKLQTNVRLVGLGEMHRELDMERTAKEIIRQASEERLIQFLALEISDSRQPDMDRFRQTGVFSERLKEDLGHHNIAYREILELARTSGLTMLCVDHRDGGNRDEFMSTMILAYMDAHPEKKGLFYAGNWHIAKQFSTLKHREIAIVKSKLSDSLKEAYYSVFQLNKEELYSHNTAYDAFTKAGISQMVGIDDVSHSPLHTITEGRPDELWSQYGRITDAIIFLPPPVD